MVTFTTKSSPDIMYVNDIAQQLLRLMGHSGSVPGAVLPDDIPKYLENLERELNNHTNLHGQQASRTPLEGEDEETAISLSTRARPLIDLLISGLDHNDPVSWK